MLRRSSETAQQTTLHGAAGDEGQTRGYIALNWYRTGEAFFSIAVRKILNEALEEHSPRPELCGSAPARLPN